MVGRVNSIQYPERYCWKISIWNKATVPRRLTNDLVVPVAIPSPSSGTPSEEFINLPRDGLISKPSYVLLLDDDEWKVDDVGSSFPLVDLVVCLVHR